MFLLKEGTVEKVECSVNLLSTVETHFDKKPQCFDMFGYCLNIDDSYITHFILNITTIPYNVVTMKNGYNLRNFPSLVTLRFL